jgi:crotonobetainyl-CoA:carnitine CoA-transferase CaiB-like acyl-CoA transferase
MLPFEGIRVVDLSRALAGPYCTMMLGDMGADVVKVEAPGVGDDSRQWGPPFEGGESSYFIGCNRNKRGITLNLKSAEGQALLWRLIEGADVFVENYSPGTMERLGVSYEEASARYPRLVYCSISGFGRSGPEAHKPAFDIILQGMSGLMSVTGEPEGNPMRTGPAISDVLAGMFAAWGIAAALYARERTGRGQRVDSTLLGADLAAMANIVSRFFATGQPPQRVGNSHAQIAPYDAIRASDGFVLVAPANDELWRRFCDALDLRPLLDEARFATNPRRVEHRPALLKAINARTSQLTRAELLARLEAAHVPCGPIRDVAEAYASPQAEYLGLAAAIAHPTAGEVRTTAIPVTLSETPGTIRRAPPLLGQHTDEVLTELGSTAEEIARWREQGVI